MNKPLPLGGAAIVEAKNFGSRRFRKFLVFGGRDLPGMKESKVAVYFSPGTPFTFQLPKDDVGAYAPMAAYYSLIPQDSCTEDFWNARKKDFSRSFSQKLASFKRQYEGMMMNDMVRRGILVKMANEAAQGCFWNVVILGMGQVVCEEKDPFDLK